MTYDDWVVSEYQRVRPWLLKAMSHDPNGSEDELIAKLKDHTAQLWAGKHCAVVTVFEPKAVKVWLIGGDGEAMKEWAEAIEPAIVEEARKQQKTTLYGEGRKGWFRHAKKFGWKAAAVVLTRTI